MSPKLRKGPPSHPHTPEVMPNALVPQTAGPLFEAIESLRFADKYRLKRFLEDFDVARLKTRNDIAIAFQGLMDLTLHCGGVDWKVLKSLELATRQLTSASNYMLRALELDFPAEIEQRLNGAIQALLDIVADVVSPEEYERIVQAFNADNVSGDKVNQKLDYQWNKIDRRE